ncbi:MAG: hypothetical protein AAF849_13425 [Bacteroidota bacterium]
MFNVPNLFIVKRFLLSKGWSIKNQDNSFQYFTPPDNINFESVSFQYALPLADNTLDYPEYMFRLSASIAELYGLNKWYIFQLFAQSVEEIQQDVALKRGILAA